jgi:hypothetical protein
MKTLVQLRHILLDYRGHSAQLQQILVSYITPCSATGHPAQLQQILVSIITPCSATGYPAQLQQILLSYITLEINYWHSLRSLPFQGPGVSRAPSPPLAHVIHSPL